MEIADGNCVAFLEKGALVHRSLVHGASGFEKVPEDGEMWGENWLWSVGVGCPLLSLHVADDLGLRHSSDAGAEMLLDEGCA